MQRSKRKDAISTLVAKGALSEDGARALTQCLDPFHDTNIFPIGLPDTRSEPSIVQIIKKSITLGTPLSGLGLWDCHIFTLPERSNWNATTVGAYVVSQVGNFYTYGEIMYDSGWYGKANCFPIAPVVIVTCNTGASTLPGGSGGIPTTLSIGVINFNDYFAGQSRIIGSATEVHNVTAEINKQGTVTVYRLPQTIEDSTTMVVDYATYTAGTGLTPYLPSKISRLPPGTIDQALLLPDSKQWEAAYGVYMVDTFDHDRNVPDVGLNCNRIFALGDRAVIDPGFITAPSIPCLAGACSQVAFTAAGAHTVGYAAPVFKPIHRNTSGAYFSGLSSQTSLTLTHHMIVETFPTQPSPLVTLARPTPDYDPMFFKLYKEAVRLLPPGVMVAENSDGGFWDTCLGIIGDIAPVVGSLIPIPGFGALGNTIGSAAKAAQKTSANQAASMAKNENQFTGSQTVPAKAAAKEQEKRNKQQEVQPRAAKMGANGVKTTLTKAQRRNVAKQLYK